MLFIGPHVSISASLSLAPERAHSLGATGFAMFTKNQRQWKSPKLKDEEIEEFKSNVKKYNFSFSSILPHAGYLINPASPDPELKDKSLFLFLDEAERVVKLGINLINIHPGAYKEGEKNDGIKRSAEMMNIVLESFPTLRIAVENTAGAGTIIGSSFDELALLYENITYKDRLGFTLDTAHLFGAGYDVKENVDGVLDEFFSLFGSDKLYGMHLNDSKVPLMSHKDRHDNIGEGLIGRDSFTTIVRRKELQNIPLILETPNEELWENEIKELIDDSQR